MHVRFLFLNVYSLWIYRLFPITYIYNKKYSPIPHKGSLKLPSSKGLRLFELYTSLKKCKCNGFVHNVPDFVSKSVFETFHKKFMENLHVKLSLGPNTTFIFGLFGDQALKAPNWRPDLPIFSRPLPSCALLSCPTQSIHSLNHKSDFNQFSG